MYVGLLVTFAYHVETDWLYLNDPYPDIWESSEMYQSWYISGIIYNTYDALPLCDQPTHQAFGISWRVYLRSWVIPDWFICWIGHRCIQPKIYSIMREPEPDLASLITGGCSTEGSVNRGTQSIFTEIVVWPWAKFKVMEDHMQALAKRNGSQTAALVMVYKDKVLYVLAGAPLRCRWFQPRNTSRDVMSFTMIAILLLNLPI